MKSRKQRPVVAKEHGRTQAFTVTILGQPYSKANSRRAVLIKGVTRFIKSDKARAYVEAFAKQCPVLDPMFEGDVHVEAVIYYETRRPDLDESLILDCLQGRVYRNDRQVRSKYIVGRIDREEPRAIITVSPLEGGDSTSDC